MIEEYEKKKEMALISTNKSNLIYMSQLAKQAERYEDMLTYIKQVVEMQTELSIEERNLLSVAYKNCIGQRRTSWRIFSQIENREEGKAKSQPNSEKKLALIRSYKKKIEGELNQYCSEILYLIESCLIKAAQNPEAIVFYLKMKGDYNTYICEYAQGNQYKQAADDALAAYTSASACANGELKTTNPIRLELALNFSVFCYEVLQDDERALQLLKSAFDAAIADYEQISEDQQQEAKTIMQLIRDNLAFPSKDDLQNI